MSKLIDVSVYTPFLTEDGKIEHFKQKLSMQEGQSLYEALIMQAGFISHAGHPDFAGCNRGVCGKCKVRFRKNAPMPTAADRKFFSADELRQGFRLACQCRLKQDAEIEICFAHEREISVLLGTSTYHKDIKRQEESELGFLVDIGTTTVVMKLVFMKTGDTILEYAAKNPQRVLGADVMTRLSEARTHKEYLQDVISECIIKGLLEVIEHVNKETGSSLDAYQIPVTVAGNTTMIHLLFGLPTDALSIYPFTPNSLQELQMEHKGFHWTALPGFSAFVGADLYADLCRISFDKKFLLLDLGTNAEMILYNGEKLYMTAAAAGTAFEGGTDGRLFGSEMIHETKELLEKKWMDETGLLMEPYFTEGIKTDYGIITNAHIRELQKAKAAVSVGIETLCEKASVWYDDIDTVYLCGGFGHFLNPQEAIMIGMLPEAFWGKIESLGNAVPEGIYQYLVNEKKRNRLMELSKEKVVVNLAEEIDFEEKYIHNLNFKNRPK